MKYKNIVKYFLCALSAVAMLGSCAQKEFEEITTISLKRCLEPQKLYARVDLATGNQVTFGWDVNKDADEYELVVYSDEEMTAEAFKWTLATDQIPYKAELVADNKYYFTVQAYKIDADGFPVESSLSNIAKYDGEVKTRAVAANLFPEVTDRTSTSISIAWSNELEDYLNVTHIEARPVRGGKTVELPLTDAMKKAAAATVEGLEASKEYQVTLCYYSASRGALDVWTMAEKGSMATVTTSEELLSIVTNGGEAFLAISGSPYTIGGSKPTASVKLLGEIGADGEKPVVIGNFDIGSTIASGSSFYFEGIKFDDQVTHNHMFNYSGEDVILGDITLVNCEVTGFKAGLLYNNKAALTVGNMTFDSCDMYDNAVTLSGDCIDIRKSTTIGDIKFVNCTLYDTFRTLFRIDTPSSTLVINLGDITFENNTVKAVAAWEHKDNRGLFALRVKTNMSLKKNLFLYEDTGLKGTTEDGKTYNNKCQLFQVNDNTVIPELNAEDNYSFAHGDAFFAKVGSAQEAGFTILSEDPCFNSKGNNFYLTDPELLDKQIGAYKWQLTYEEKVEDLTQNVVSAPHVWNLQDAKLFAGTAKNSRVRDELLIVATEENPVNLDGAVKFLNATPRTKKGVPTEGYIAFKVDKAGSVDILVTDPDKAGGTVSIALQDDNGFAVQGGAAASASNPTIQKVVIPEVKGEGTVYIFATAPAAITELAWSSNVTAGNKVLATPKLVVEPVTLTEGDETPVTVTWNAVANAESYTLKFNKTTVSLEPGALSYTVPAETIAALNPGLYTFTIKALPAEGDLYYSESQEGTASIAVQPKAQQGGGAMVEKSIVWDFSSDSIHEWMTGIVATENTNASFDGTIEGLYIKSTSGKWRTKSAGLYYLQFGQAAFEEGSTTELKDHYMKFTTTTSGTLTITAANTGGSNPARDIYVRVGDADPDKGGAFEGTTGREAEFDIAAGEVYIYPGDGGLSVYKIEYIYEEFDPNASIDDGPKEDFVWDFSSDSIHEWMTGIVATENTNASFDGTIEGLYIKSTSGKWRTKSAGLYYLQFGQAAFEEGSTTELKDHYMKFTTTTSGTLTITAANTGGSNPARDIYVRVGDADPDKGGAFEGTTGKAFSFDIAAGEVYVYPGDGGLSVYKLEYHSK